MKIKKLFAAFSAVVVALTLSSCAPLGSNVDELLVAPKLEGDMYPIQQALEAAAGDNITLKYPISGEYRSALVLNDINNDGSDEAIAFYSTTTDKTVSMHINVIAYDGENWKSRGDLSIVGSGVESVSFSDLDGNGSMDIIVGWMIYGTVDKQVGIYTFDNGNLVQRAIEPYTNFICEDITNDGVNDLSVIYLNSSEKTAGAKIFSLTDIGISEAGSVTLDPGVSSYSAPVLSALSDGTPAIYIDAVKGSGMHTEIIWFKDGTLRTIYDPAAPEYDPTYRPSTVACRDYNGDGVIDIPMAEILVSTSNLIDSDKVWFTNWSDYNGSEFNILESTFMNYSDGYSLAVPERLKNNIHLVRFTEDRLRIFYEYEPVTGNVGREVFRYIAVPEAEYDAGLFAAEGYIHLTSSGGFEYLTRYARDNTLDVTEETVRDMFSIIQ